MEKIGVTLGVVIFLAGFIMVIAPQPGAVRHATNGAFGMQQGIDIHVVTETGARVYGVIALLLGAAIVSISRYRGKS